MLPIVFVARFQSTKIFVRKVSYACITLAALVVSQLNAQVPPLPVEQTPTVEAPPPNEGVLSRDTTPVQTMRPLSGGATLYSIGQPTDEEQLYLEYINRSRANPSAEGVRLAGTTDPDVLSAYSAFAVNLSLMQSEFSTNPAVPPLAMNAQLLAAARSHSADMFTNQYQDHTGTDGSTPTSRISSQGYNWNTAGENIFAYSKSTFYGHAGLNVDWGPGAGGMQTPPGHRNNMHFPGFREIGIGVVDGVNGSVGPQLVTQDFGAQPSAVPTLSGVVYYDLNAKNFYDLGEGIGGVRVDVNGSSYYALTANSGGFTVPVTTNGNYTVVFSGNGLSSTQTVTVSGQKNVKVDYVPTYAPPVIVGPNPASVNRTNLCNFNVVGGATSYEWEQSQLLPYTAIEGAENGLTKVTAQVSISYAVIITDLKRSGSAAFHLAHPADPSSPTDQFLVLNTGVRPSTNSQLMFYKRLGWATSSQVGRAQVSTNSGATWQDVWTQSGNGTSGDASFTQVSVSLAPFNGLVIKVRFMYDILGGSYFPQTTSDVGLCLDDIAFSNVNQQTNLITNSIPSGTAFAFYPTNSGTFLLRVRPLLPGRTLDWGPASVIAVGAAPPAIQLNSSPVLTATQFQIDFVVTDFRSGMTFQLWKASDPAGTWTVDTSAILQTLVANSKFRMTASTGGATRMFYKVRGSY